jgi:eukaryotic-like serine/threonine-protein kinase
VTGGALQDPFGLAGTLLEGQYRADEVVGEGGFGVVYRGRHLSLDQPIAIKVLKGLDSEDPRINALVLEKFRAEARLLYTLSQSSLHIVRALDFGATTTPSGAWAPFMVLEWLDGCSLADDLVDRRKRGLRGRSVAEAFAILQPVADGLAVAHQRHVAHRDIKPANIFLLAENASTMPQGPQVKVLDFGIAKIMKDGESAGTKGTFASFTWAYASPEQLDPRLGTTGLATDVYGFGLLITELLTDRRPSEQRDVVGIMKAALDPMHRPTPRKRGANIPDAIEAVCLRALAVDPKARFESVRELWSALVAAHGGGGSSLTAMQAAVAPISVMAPQQAGGTASFAPLNTPPPTPSLQGHIPIAHTATPGRGIEPRRRPGTRLDTGGTLVARLGHRLDAGTGCGSPERSPDVRSLRAAPRNQASRVRRAPADDARPTAGHEPAGLRRSDDAVSTWASTGHAPAGSVASEASVRPHRRHEPDRRRHHHLLRPHVAARRDLRRRARRVLRRGRACCSTWGPRDPPVRRASGLA